LGASPSRLHGNRFNWIRIEVCDKDTAQMAAPSANAFEGASISIVSDLLPRLIGPEEPEQMTKTVAMASGRVIIVVFHFSRTRSLYVAFLLDHHAHRCS
jgi:hypothetical protein